MIGLALSGGGSRAIAFHLGCLRALDDLGLLHRVGVMSTVSGGSVIGAYYAYHPNLTFSDFEAQITAQLKRGFHARIALELAKPNNLIACLASVVANGFGTAANRVGIANGLRRYRSRTDMLSSVLDRDLFHGLTIHSPTRNGLQVVIGACELRTGAAFRFSTGKTGDWRHGEMMSGDGRLAFAVAASAAYPLFLPALDRRFLFRKGDEVTPHRVLLVDGGVYDNLGLQVLEPGRDPSVSLQAYPCEYIICCNAGHGQGSGELLPTTYYQRAKQSFAVVHRRVQDASMHRLHQLKQARLVRGFALPYLGQIDERLPWRPPELVPRREVVTYPTNFKAMSVASIKRLSDRGEQLTRALVTYYVPELLT